MARAVMAAAEPLVEMLLEMGITSPEAESLLRSVFVHRARSWLLRLDPNAPQPSDARVALVTGVHRNFVRHILAEPPRIASSRQQKGSRAGRLLNAWYSDPSYLDESGKPRDLPEKGGAPSFQSLAGSYLPGTAPGVLLAELKRSGLVQRLPDERLRARRRAARVHGFTLADAMEIGERTQELVETLRHNLRHPDQARPFESIPAIEVEEEEVGALRDLISRRAAAFLARLEQEIVAAGEARPGLRTRKKVLKLGLTLFATEQRADDPEP
jgi:hypothetical protein